MRPGLLDYIRNFAAAWSRAKPTTRAGMIQAVYQDGGPSAVASSSTSSSRMRPTRTASQLPLPQEVERAGAGDAGRNGPRKIVGFGAPDRIRTCDLRLRRPTLYPLSYRRADCGRFRA